MRTAGGRRWTDGGRRGAAGGEDGAGRSGTGATDRRPTLDLGSRRRSINERPKRDTGLRAGRGVRSIGAPKSLMKIIKHEGKPFHISLKTHVFKQFC